MNAIDGSDTIQISLNGVRVGTLTRLVNDTIVFAFDPDYEADLQRPILSLCYKGAHNVLVPDKIRSAGKLPPFFSNLLPEGHLRDYLCLKHGIKPHREFHLLSVLGRDLPGAVVAEPVGRFVEILDDASEPASKPATLRFSLAGIQLKFSAITEATGTFTIPAKGVGGSWIVKLPSERHQEIPETEFAMLKFAQLVGIEVPEFRLVPTNSIDGLPREFGKISSNSLAVKRFDRTASGGRIHMEDFAQVYGLYPADKYERAGYGHIARVMWAEAGQESYSEFLRRLVFTVCIGNGDMHLKNWSLLYRNPTRPAISPAYDFVPTIAFIEDDRLGLSLGGSKDFQSVTVEKFKKIAAQAMAPEKLTLKVVGETVERISDVWSNRRDELPLKDEIKAILDEHMSKLPLLNTRR